VALLCLATSTAADCEQPQFKADANSRVTAGFKTIRRRGQVSHDYRTIEIIYYPFQMVEDAGCVDEDQLNLEVQSGENSEWVAMEVKPNALGGGKYKWSIPAVPCLQHRLKFWVNGPAGQASLEYAEPVPAATTEEIIAAKFVPEMPTGLTVTHLPDGGGVRVTWEASECATAYDISYGSSADNMRTQVLPAQTELVLDDLQPCTDYDISLFSMVGEEDYSIDEASTRFTTPPETGSAASLNPIVQPGTNSLLAKWQAYEKLSCVSRYAVSVCKEGEAECQTAGSEVERSDTLDYIQFETDQLEHCSAYTLHIQPIYDASTDNGDQQPLQLDPKIVEFRTKSPSADGAADDLLPVSAEAGEGQKIFVKWSGVQCAEFYEVFQKVNSVDDDSGDWEVVHRTTNTSAELNGVPCTEYRYGVQVSIDGQRSEIVAVEGAVVTQLDSASSFIAPNLEVSPLEDGAVFTWDHGACIASYIVKVCHEEDPNVALDADADQMNGNLICEEEEIVRDSSVHNVTHIVHGLRPCAAHFLEILPQVSGEQFEPNRVEFRTAFPTASPPAEFDAVYKQGSNRVELEWSEVQCASGYKILQQTGSSDTTTVWETDNPQLLFTSLESPEPCVTYSYGVSAVVGLADSEPTSMKMFSIPPRQGSSNKPRLDIVDNKNDTIHMTISPAPTNIKCQVEVYEVRFSSLKHGDLEQREFQPESLPDNQHIVLNFAGASGPGLSLEGRIKYQGFDKYSPWIKSKELTSQTHEQLPNGSALVPIIIGILVGIVILVIIIFFVVRRKRSQNKYDAEKAGANGNKDETQKLSEHAEA